MLLTVGIASSIVPKIISSNGLKKRWPASASSIGKIVFVRWRTLPPRYLPRYLPHLSTLKRRSPFDWSMMVKCLEEGFGYCSSYSLHPCCRNIFHLNIAESANKLLYWNVSHHFSGTTLPNLLTLFRNCTSSLDEPFEDNKMYSRLWTKSSSR